MTALGALRIVDLEWTAWEGLRERGWSGPREHHEILQISAICLSPDLKEQDHFSLLVGPVRNPILSDYVRALTGLSQKAIDAHGLDAPLVPCSA